MIPVLGVPVLNRPELLREMLASIDHSIGEVVIIDNGNVVHDFEGTRRRRVIKPHHNLGVGASWNLIMQVTPWAPWWLIVNSDIEFRPGDLARLDEAVDPQSATIYHQLGFAAFAMTAIALERVGYFDENFHPAYDEDLDMSRRCELASVPRVNVDAGLRHVGSATIYGNERYRALNARTHPANDRYYERKWGGHKHGGETFSTPFNRGGHIGDWRLEPERLRDQAWEIDP